MEPQIQIERSDDDAFLVAVKQLFDRKPAKFTSTLIGFSVLLFTLGWNIAKMLEPPAGVRERAALEAAFRANRLDIPKESDLVLMIEDFSAAVNNRDKELQKEIDGYQALAQRSSCRNDPGLVVWWMPGTALVNRCKSEGASFFREAGFLPDVNKDSVGDTLFSAENAGIAATVVCSNKLDLVILAVAANKGCGGAEADDFLSARFLTFGTR